MTPTEALQAWLALEHEAVWLLPVIGARFDGLLDVATTSYDAHRVVRDDLVGRLRQAGISPVPTRLSYVMGRLDTTTQARGAVRKVEVRISAACLALARVGEGDTRAYGLKGLTRAALAELTWGAKPHAFPGLP